MGARILGQAESGDRGSGRQGQCDRLHGRNTHGQGSPARGRQNSCTGAQTGEVVLTIENHSAILTPCTAAMVFRQHELRLPGLPRGCHLVTQHILQEIGPSLQGISVGLCHVFIKHTSASLTLNENADPDVRVRAAPDLGRG